MSRRGDARAIYGAALRSVDAATAVQRALAARPPAGPVVVVGAGKAVRGMATGALQALGPRVLGGLVVAPAPAELGPIRVRVGDHPLPTQRSLRAGEALRQFVGDLPTDAQVLGLWSGGASAMAVAPVQPLDTYVAAQNALVATGADIHELNAWRIAHSRLKGGRLRALAPHASWRNLVISDVLGDDPAVVGSGPGVSADAPGELVLTRRDALRGAEAEAWALRYAVTVLSDDAAGDAAELGQRLAHALTLGFPGQPPMALLVAGEPTLRLPAEAPPGGRMQHAALAAALVLEGTEAVVLAAGTDGRDGPTEAAGALVDGGTAGRVRAAGIDPVAALDAADSHRALAAAGDLLDRVDTGTNVGDLLIGLSPPVRGV